MPSSTRDAKRPEGHSLHTSGQVSWLADHHPTDAFPFPVASVSVVSPLTVTSSPGILPDSLFIGRFAPDTRLSIQLWLHYTTYFA